MWLDPVDTEGWPSEAQGEGRPCLPWPHPSASCVSWLLWGPGCERQFPLQQGGMGSSQPHRWPWQQACLLHAQVCHGADSDSTRLLHASVLLSSQTRGHQQAHIWGGPGTPGGTAQTCPTLWVTSCKGDFLVSFPPRCSMQNLFLCFLAWIHSNILH